VLLSSEYPHWSVQVNTDGKWLWKLNLNFPAEPVALRGEMNRTAFFYRGMH
jgi:hypothetical protein